MLWDIDLLGVTPVLHLPGYEIDKKLHESSHTVVYSGSRIEGDLPVVIKVSADEFPSSEEIKRFRRELELGAMVAGNRTIHYHGIEPYKHGLALITEHFGAVGLGEVIPTSGMDTIRFLAIAIQLAEGLAAIHGHGLIHRDIKPGNIVICPESGEVKYIDFGHSTPMDETGAEDPREYLQGTLAYMSPEQTGRMNRPVDYRTDFYSLGATFYQMLTGRLPFHYEDTLEMVHAHIARVPDEPHAHRETIPLMISKIVMKLMAKNADDRYQSGRGLCHDLEHCLEDLEHFGEVRPFRLGTSDSTNRFSIPQKLYGRERELELLMQAYERVTEGNREMILIDGYSGVGKTALVDEVRTSIFANKGYFVRGACDQGRETAAYLPIRHACGEWVRQVLGERDDEVAEWRARLADVLGPNRDLVLEVIPEMAHLLGQEGALEGLGALEIRNRFGMVFRSLVKGIADRGHPLVLFLDDLHWADTLTIKLLEMLLTDKDLGYLLVIGTTKQHVLDGNQEMGRVVEEIERRGTRVTRIRLGPLEGIDLTRLLVDTLHCEPEEARPLADILISKTNGNPFFTIALLKNLYHEKHLRFCHEQTRWDWDLSQVRRIHVSENVIDFMITRLKKLSPETQQVLQLAACFGSRFELARLAELADRDEAHIDAILRETLRHGVIVEPAGEENQFFEFQHDRVQQAAYALIDEQAKMEHHLAIGRMMIERKDENVFELVHHLNQGRELMASEEERLSLARLNLTAGKKARAATTFEAALKYLRTSFSLMPEDAWERFFDLVFALFWESAECNYLAGNFKSAERFSGRLLEMAITDLQKAAIYRMRLVHYTYASRMKAAVEAGIRGLALLGLEVNPRPSRWNLMRRSLAVRRYLLGYKPEDLTSYRELSNEKVAAVIETLAELGQPAYLTGNKALFTYSILERVLLTFRHGISPMSANTFAMFGFLLSSVLGRLALGARFGEAALALSEKFGNPTFRSMTLYSHAIFIHCWNHPWKTLPQRLARTLEVSLESGDPLYASYAVSAMNYFDPNQDLDTAIEESEHNLALIENFKGQDTWRFAHLVQQFRMNLVGKTRNRYALDGADFDEQECLAHFREHNVATGAALYHLLKMRLCYLYERYKRADHHREELARVVKSITGQPFSVEACFYSFLVVSARIDGLAKNERRRAIRLLRGALNRMKRWANHNPTNFNHHRYLMEAEWCRLRGRFSQAARFYRKAMEAAHRHGSYGDEALVSELSGKFYRQHFQEKIASMFYTDAHYLYGRWGAVTKVSQLEEQHGALLRPNARAGARDVSLERTSRLESRRSKPDSIAGKSEALDLATVTKWSLAIASEMNLEKLLSKMMQIIIENAGAQKGFLILDHQGRMNIEATLTVDSGEVDLEPVPLESNTGLSRAIVRYVIRTGDNVVLKDAAREGLFMEDRYVLGHRPKSILCTPIRQKERISGVLYLENNLVTNAFTQDRIRILNILLAQAAISLENARLYHETKEGEDRYRRLNEQLEERVRERTRELEAAQKELVEKAHFAGMADIATSVLHNVGNILNSVITSGQILERRMDSSWVRKLTMANTMLRQNMDNLETFMVEDPKGRQLLEYYLRLEAPLENETREMRDEVSRLVEKVNTIREVIMAQQSHASRGFQEDMLSICDVVEEALAIVENAYARSGIRVETHFEEVPPVFVQKVKLIHILVNILKNAREALTTTPEEDRRVTIEIHGDIEHNLIRIHDNGTGIAEAEMGKLFIQGYTTKPGGHGFGLHSCANAMTEMSGNIWAESDGPGKGATFVLQFPVEREMAVSGVLASGAGEAGY